jgi:hypothetical protein
MKEIIGLAEGRRMVVKEDGKERRLRNWYRIDFGWGRDEDDFTWGYEGTGPHTTAYSILRELYGQKFATEYHHAFVLVYVSKLPENEDFILTTEELDSLMPDIMLQKWTV